MAVIIGDSGNNLLTGSIGADSISGLAGNDTLIGGDGADTLDGGADSDSLNGGIGNDSLTGGLDNDFLVGGGGDDVLDGGGGDDVLSVALGSYEGDATALGGAGNDTISGSFFATVDAGADNDLVTMAARLTKQVTLIDGGTGVDTLRIDVDLSIGAVAFDFTKAVNFEVFSFSPTLNATLSDANISSSGHLDVLMVGGLGSSYGFSVDGSAITSGSLTITGGGGSNVLKGGSGADSLTTGASSDTLQGGAGNDTLHAGAGSDTAIFSGNYAQYVIGQSGDAVTVTGPDGSDMLYGVNFLQFDDQTVAVVIPPVIATGDENANLMTGDEGNDVLSGAGGNDTLIGGDANDSLNGDAGADSLAGGLGDDSLYGGLDNDNLSAGGGNDLLDGGGGDDNLAGYFGNGYQGDIKAYGGAGNDSISGAFFTDVDAGGDNDSVVMGGRLFKQVTLIDGGLGNDTLRIDNDANTGAVALDYSKVVNFETIILGPTASATLANATVTNGHLDISMSGGLGFSYGITVNGSAITSGSLTIIGGGGSNVLKGGSGADSLTTGAANDTLQGGGGSDTLHAGAGSDTAIFSGNYAQYVIGQSGDAVTVTGPDGSDMLYGVNFLQFNDQTVAVVIPPVISTGDANPNLITGDEGNDILSGAGGNDTLIGSDANDSLNGDAGADSLDGGLGDDSLYGGLDNDMLRAGGGNDLLDGGDGADSLFGYSGGGYEGDVQAYGGAGNDTISGAFFTDVDAGADDDSVLIGRLLFKQVTLIDGGAGNDTLTIDADSGTGAVAIDYTRLVNFETFRLSPFANAVLSDANISSSGRLTVILVQGLGSSYGFSVDGSAVTAGDLVITGGGGGNDLKGGSGDDTFVVGAGDDTLDGGAGNDTADYSIADQGLKIRLSLTTAQVTGQGSDTLVSIENLVGGAFKDRLTGNGLDNVLEGRGGKDQLDGGAGIDTASYEHAASGVTVSLATNKASGGAGKDRLKNFENLLGSAFADKLTGDLANNHLIGGGGDDTIEGGAGDDTLEGGAGLNTLSYAGAGSAVTVSLLAGTASGGAGSDVFTGFGQLTGSAFGDTLTGNSQANLIVGGAGADTIDGGAGQDTLIGGAGADSLNGGTGVDIASYADAASAVSVDLSVAGPQNTLGAGTDTLVAIEGLTGSGFDDHLTGSSAANVLDGGLGKDSLTGGGGKDVLTGGAGADVFVFLSVADSHKGKTADLITDLTSSDRIDLSAIDADTGTGGDQAFHLVSAFTHTAGELKLSYDSGTGLTLLQADVNGDGKADLVIKLDGDQHLFTHFVL